jgi:hypothetical protein
MIFNRIKDFSYKYFKNKFIYEYQVQRVLNENEREILFGRIIKYQKNKKVEKWDEEHKDIIEAISENDIHDKVYFYYDKNTEYLIIEDRGKLDIEMVKEVMTYLINYKNIEFKVDLNSIKCADKLNSRIKQLSKITWAHLKLSLIIQVIINCGITLKR